MSFAERLLHQNINDPSAPYNFTGEKHWCQRYKKNTDRQDRPIMSEPSPFMRYWQKKARRILHEVNTVFGSYDVLRQRTVLSEPIDQYAVLELLTFLTDPIDISISNHWVGRLFGDLLIHYAGYVYDFNTQSYKAFELDENMRRKREKLFTLFNHLEIVRKSDTAANTAFFNGFKRFFNVVDGNLTGADREGWRNYITNLTQSKMDDRGIALFNEEFGEHFRKCRLSEIPVKTEINLGWATVLNGPRQA